MLPRKPNINRNSTLHLVKSDQKTKEVSKTTHQLKMVLSGLKMLNKKPKLQSTLVCLVPGLIPYGVMCRVDSALRGKNEVAVLKQQTLEVSAGMDVGIPHSTYCRHNISII